MRSTALCRGGCVAVALALVMLGSGVTFAPPAGLPTASHVGTVATAGHTNRNGAQSMGASWCAVSGLSALAAMLIRPRAASVARAAEDDGKINKKVDLESAKVVNMETLEAGSKKVYCRCWLSGTFPLCDGAHAKHNKETGDNVGPLIVSAPKSE
mmetsp:Transcript_92768/g.215590  ORF Transcript_92768/g.215590 Transcript_92768/m.215590 type:complete len:155 (-) Transcript_92768:103-567(-)